MMCGSQLVIRLRGETFNRSTAAALAIKGLSFKVLAAQTHRATNSTQVHRQLHYLDTGSTNLGFILAMLISGKETISAFVMTRLWFEPDIPLDSLVDSLTIKPS